MGFLDEINCVRWSPSGDMIASGSNDDTSTIGLQDWEEALSWEDLNRT
mgnify:CR=1 FL=1